MKTITIPHLKVNIKNIAHNYNALCQHAKSVCVASVVKDDSYGLGCKEISEALYAQGCDTFFVDYAPLGLAIRPYVGNSKIYLLQGIGEDTLSYVKQGDLIPVLSTFKEWQLFKNNFSSLKVGINVETGLNRLGFRQNELAQLSDSDRDSCILCMSHLACSSEPSHSLNQKQRCNFINIQPLFKNALFSLAASDALRLGPDFYFDMIRVGANLYGINLSEKNKHYLKQAISIQATVLQTAILPKGESVSYGARYIAQEERKIAIVGIGYGDGFSRSLSNGKGKVFFKNHSAPVLGTVCMDNIICDVTDIPEIQEGDIVDILNDNYTPDDMGQDAGTIGYEIISNFGKNKRFVKTIIK